MDISSARPTRTGRFKKIVASALVAALVLPVNLSAYAANHPLTALSDVNTTDYVANVDWDFDKPGLQVGSNSQLVDRKFIIDTLTVTAKSIFTFTEGRHRVGTVFVYRNKQFGNNVDIQIINKEGRSNAHAAGWGKSGGFTSHNYTNISGTPYSIDEHGKVIAHEMGHYTYGLLDEYADNTPNSTLPKIPSFPQFGDTEKPTMMKNHVENTRLSIPSDYADPTLRVTAQARVHGFGDARTTASAWETLTRTPDKDPPEGQKLNRTFWEAFRGIDANTLQITNPTVGFDKAFKVVFVTDPVFRDVLIFDRTMAPNRLPALITAAKTLVAEAKADTQFAILTSPPIGTGPLLGYTPGTDAGKAALIAALDSIQTATTGTFDGLAVFTQAYSLLAAARQPGDPSTFHLLAGTETSVPAETATTARTARVSVNPLTVSGATPTAVQAYLKRAQAQSSAGAVVNLSQLAKQTGGVYNAGKNATEIAQNALRGLKESHGEAFAPISFDQSPGLIAGGQFSSKFGVASGATDGTVSVEMYFNPKDAAKLTFSLIGPDNTIYTPANMPAGLNFKADLQEGLVEFSIYPNFAGRVGQWTAKAVAGGPVAEGVGVEVSSDSEVGIRATFDGGSAGALSGPVLRASLGGEQRIRDAIVTATIYSEEGALLLSDVVMKDDGLGFDSMQGDGQYTADLSGKLPPGEYFAVIKAQTNTNSRISAHGQQVKGALVAEVPVDIFTRITEVSMALDAGARGVMVVAVTPTPGASNPTPGASTPAAGSSAAAATRSGGCTVNPLGDDAGLVLLLLAGAAGWMLRRRRPSK